MAKQYKTAKIGPMGMVWQARSAAAGAIPHPLGGPAQ